VEKLTDFEFKPKEEHHAPEGEHKKQSEHHENHKPQHGHHERKESHRERKEPVKVHKLLIAAAVIQIILLVFIVSQLNGMSSNQVDGPGNKVLAPTPTPTPVPTPPAAINMADLLDDDSVKGDPDAPVTIVEWSDYECPFCARFFDQTLGQIDEKYIKTGKVKLVYRDFPLSFHPQAQKAAEAAECAGEQGKYFEMHDELFKSGVQGGVPSFKGYAKTIGLDSTEFDTCLDSGSMAAEVQKDFQDGQRAGVQGTPGFIINGVLVSGAQPFSAFEQVIEAALAS
jgi:protein-disulfide isomerase